MWDFVSDEVIAAIEAMKANSQRHVENLAATIRGVS